MYRLSKYMILLNEKESCISYMKKIAKKKVLSQINAYIETYFSDHLVSFQKSLSPQHCLIKILETIKFPLDNWDDTVTVFINLSKPFQFLNR